MTPDAPPQPTFQQEGQQVDTQYNVVGNYVAPLLIPISAVAPALPPAFGGRHPHLDEPFPDKKNSVKVTLF